MKHSLQLFREGTFGTRADNTELHLRGITADLEFHYNQKYTVRQGFSSHSSWLIDAGRKFINEDSLLKLFDDLLKYFWLAIMNTLKCYSRMFSDNITNQWEMWRCFCLSNLSISVSCNLKTCTWAWWWPYRLKHVVAQLKIIGECVKVKGLSTRNKITHRDATLQTLNIRFNFCCCDSHASLQGLISKTHPGSSSDTLHEAEWLLPAIVTAKYWRH
jgi:hypothetical protein